MDEMSEVRVYGDDTVVTMKVHRLAYARMGMVYASLIGAANSAKVIRAGMSGKGRAMKIQVGEYDQANVRKDQPYRFRFAGLGNGYVHVEIRYQPEHAIVLPEDTIDEWRDELMRVSTAPILPEWVPVLRDRIKAKGEQARLTCLESDSLAYKAGDGEISKLLVEACQAGTIELPECEIDMGTLEGLPAYIEHYADKMVESAGSALRPLFDPKLEQPEIPAMKRDPFVPQAWVVEAVKRAVA